jgi:hypothetical protein
MTDQQQDEILQLSLKALEEGAPLEDVLRDLPPGYRNVAALNRLVDSSRAINHPRMSYARAQYRLKSILQTSKRHLEASTWLRGKVMYLAFSLGLVTLFVMAFLLFSGPGSFIASHSAELKDTSGIIEISSGANSEKWSFATDGDRIKAGMHIRTYIDSSTTLVFPDGSRTVLAPESEITLTELSGKEDFIQVRYVQDIGVSDNQVVPFANKDSSFIVDTTAGEISVHGTRFSVQVFSPGLTRVAVDSGEVKVSRDDSIILVNSGKALLVDANMPLDYPLFEFSLQGDLKSITGNLWNVGGVSFFVGNRTSIDTDMQSGDIIMVRGRILETGEPLADIITLADNDVASSDFGGVVDSISDGSMVINGREVLVNSKSDINQDIGIGDTVVVTFLVSSEGGWQALKVASAEHPDVDLVAGIVPGSTPSPYPTNMPTQSNMIASQPSAKGACENEKLQPGGVKLAEKYDVSYDTIMGWFCEGFDLGEIDLAYELSSKSENPVDELFSLRTTGLGWDDIRKEFEPEITLTPSPTLELKPTKEIKPTRESKPTNVIRPTLDLKPTLELEPTLEPRPTLGSGTEDDSVPVKVP